MTDVYDDADLEGLEGEELANAIERRERMKNEFDSVTKKSNKTKEVEKSLIVLEVKPWDETTNLVELWNKIVEYQQEGLTWGEGYKLEPVFAEINKLVMSCSIIDSLVLTDDITEYIESLEDYVQSVDITAMTKL